MDRSLMTSPWLPPARGRAMPSGHCRRRSRNGSRSRNGTPWFSGHGVEDEGDMEIPVERFMEVFDLMRSGNRSFRAGRLKEVTYVDKPCQIVMKLKRWERIKCKLNSLPILHKMHVKLGDTVKVIAGRDKGKIGEITQIFKHNSTVIVKDINLKTKHMKSKEQGEPGQIVMVVKQSSRQYEGKAMYI